jgi:predicted nucleotidyltransferase
MINKNEIIGKLNDALKPLPYIYAFWLEGADANGSADEYSDIDIWVDFEDEYEEQAYEAVEKALSDLAVIDYKYVGYVDPNGYKIRCRKYHLAGTSEYLMIDFNWQFHSRPKDEYVFFEDNTIEAAKVIFDKDNIIQYKQLDLSEFVQQNKSRLEEAKYRMAQYMRVEKYVRRGQFLEAFANYNCYILESLIDLLRLIYTPTHAHYRYAHISRHIPESERVKLEYFVQVKSLDDIAVKIPQAEKWFDELVEKVG